MVNIYLLFPFNYVVSYGESCPKDFLNHGEDLRRVGSRSTLTAALAIISFDG